MSSHNHDEDVTELDLVYNDFWHASAHIEKLIVTIADQQKRVEALEAALEDKDEALQKIESWSRAYPLDIFPEPDWKRATELLKAGGVTMDAVSAHCMRHVVEGVGKIARAALAPASATLRRGKPARLAEAERRQEQDK